MVEAEARESGVLVMGSGMAGITAAIEAMEAGNDVFIVEKEPYLGGRVAGFNKYFPKLCPPSCGLEINFRRIKNGHRRLKFFTLAEVERVSGGPGAFDVTVRLNPRFVLQDRCTACGLCVDVCPEERPNQFNYGMSTTKAIYLPHEMAMPMKYVIEEGYCQGDSCSKCVQVCPTDAIDLRMTASTLNLKVASIIVATGWKPYDATQLDLLGFQYPNVISNVMMERLTAPNGPTKGKLLRPSDGKPAKRVAFVQCAGSRDVNHLPYCSAICCLSSLKEATYVREQYPDDSRVYIFYIDIRAPGNMESFYRKVEQDDQIRFIKGKVAKVEEDPATGNIIVEADDMVGGRKVQATVDLLVLSTGMVPNTKDMNIPGLPLQLDESGFGMEDRSTGVYLAGVSRRPMDVTSSTRDGTGAALKAIQTTFKIREGASQG